MSKQKYPADPNDVASIDAIIAAVYDVISGKKGQKRNWRRFRSLYYPGARMMPSAMDAKNGDFGAQVLDTEGYIARVEPIFAEQSFFENEKAGRVDRFGNIAHVLSTYEARRSPADKSPFLRGINSFQLLFDGKRWWVLSVFWQAETTDTPIPAKYLRSR